MLCDPLRFALHLYWSAIKPSSRFRPLLPLLLLKSLHDGSVKLLHPPLDATFQHPDFHNTLPSKLGNVVNVVLKPSCTAWTTTLGGTCLYHKHETYGENAVCTYHNKRSLFWCPLCQLDLEVFCVIGRMIVLEGSTTSWWFRPDIDLLARPVRR